MKYSVIMPTLTRTQEHLEVATRCAETVVEHTKDFEFIVVNDGSSKRLGKIQRLATTYIRHKKPQGIAPSWNDGLKIARGEYMIVINDDIEAVEGWAERMADLFKDPYCGVAGLAVEHMPRGSGIEENHTWFPGSCFMVSQQTLKMVGYFDEQFTPFNFEDVDYWTRVLKAGGKLMRDYALEIPHKEGDVIKKLSYDDVSNQNRKKYIKKWGFNPHDMFYGSGRKAW